MGNIIDKLDTEYYAIILTIGVVIFIVGLLRELLSTKLPASDIMLSTLVGILLGPSVSSVINPFTWSSALNMNEMGSPIFTVPMIYKYISEIMRVVLAIQLVATGFSVPWSFFKKAYRSQLVLLTLVMIGMWLMGSLVVFVSFKIPYRDSPSFSFWEALLIGACITPTDPVVSSAITTTTLAERTLPSRVRNTIILESSLNDGLGYPFVMLPIIFITQTEKSVGSNIGTFVLQTFLYQVVLSVIIGVLVGYLIGKLLIFAEPKKLHDKQLLVALAVGFSFVFVGTFRLLNLDELLGVFVGSMMYALVIEGPRRESRTQLQETVDLLFSSLAFVFFGLIIPWNKWGNIIGPSRGVVLVLGVLLLRRLPWVFGFKPLLKPQIRSNLEAGFVGWFGPIGISALFYSTFAVNQTGAEETWHVVSFVVFVSVVAFGLTDTMLTKLYGKLNPNKQKQTELKQKQQEREQDVADADVFVIEREIQRREERQLKKQESVELLYISPIGNTNQSGLSQPIPLEGPIITIPSNHSDYSNVGIASVSVVSPPAEIVREEVKQFEHSVIEPHEHQNQVQPIAVIPEAMAVTTEKETQTLLLVEAEKSY